MMLPDVNVLVGAYRADHPNHEICRNWLDRLMTSGEGFGISPPTLSAVIRIATDARVFSPPSTMRDAIEFCNDLLEHPPAVRIVEGNEHWSIFTQLCQSPGIKGPLTSDAWFAALAIESGCEWVTLDRDFKRFPGLRWRTP